MHLNIWKIWNSWTFDFRAALWWSLVHRFPPAIEILHIMPTKETNQRHPHTHTHRFWAWGYAPQPPVRFVLLKKLRLVRSHDKEDFYELNSLLVSKCYKVIYGILCTHEFTVIARISTMNNNNQINTCNNRNMKRLVIFSIKICKYEIFTGCSINMSTCMIISWLSFRCLELFISQNKQFKENSSYIDSQFDIWQIQRWTSFSAD